MIKIFASPIEFDRELKVYMAISKQPSYQDFPLSRLICPLELTSSGARCKRLAVPAHAGALVVWPLADKILSNLQYNRKDAFYVADSILRALDALHELRICHADMSNSNVLVQCTEPIKVILMCIAFCYQFHSICFTCDVLLALCCDQVFVNDFNASIPVGTIIQRNFVTTWNYASARVKMANRDNHEWVYLEVDDFAAACAVMCEYAQISVPRDAVIHNAFAHNPLQISEGDPFHLFLKGLHGVLSPCITLREVSGSMTQAVKTWVRQHLQRSPNDAFDHYSSS